MKKIFRKSIQLTIALGILVGIEKFLGYKTAVLVGLAMNSADLNEAREKLAGCCGNSKR